MQRFTIEDIYAKKEQKRIREKIIRGIIYMLVIPLLIYNIIILYQVIFNSETIPSFLGYKTFVIVSGSMVPSLNVGDVVIIKDVAESEIQKDDIISFREGNSIITHRVNDIIITDSEKEYQTKGDANNTEDSNLVKFKDIEGEYFGKIPKVGNAILFIQNKFGILIIFGILYFSYILNKNKEEKIMMRKQKRKIFENINKENK